MPMDEDNSKIDLAHNSDANERANRFKTSGRLEDLDEAMLYSVQEVFLMLDGHALGLVALEYLGSLHQRRFERLGEPLDIDKAIIYQFQGFRAIPDGHADKPRWLNNLGMSRKSRFERLGELSDIDQAIVCMSQAVLLTPDGHADKPSMLNNLGSSRQSRFSRLGELSDLDQAIACQSQALRLTPDGYASKPIRLNNLGATFRSRFLCLGEISDIDQAITYQSQAVSLTPDGHADKPKWLSNLGSSHRSRFDRVSELSDIDQAIACQSQAIKLTPDGHTDKLVHLNNLGNSYRSRFDRLGELSDIDQAIASLSQAVLLTPDKHAGKPSMLNNLGISRRSRFNRLGELSDIDQAIACLSQTVLLTQDDHADKPGHLNNLGISYQSRFDRLGELLDIDQAIAYQSKAVKLTSDGDAYKPIRLNNLGTLLRSRFTRTGKLSDIDQAITCQSQAVLLTPDGHADKPTMLTSLGISHLSRFDRTSELPDIDQAIACNSQAVLRTPDGHADKPGRLNNLGVSHQSRFNRLDKLSDIDQAIAYQSQAVQLAPDGHAERPGWLNNLGNSYQFRFDRLGEVSDIDHAIGSHSQAVLLTPDAHADKPIMLYNLGTSHRSRFNRLGELSDLDQAITYKSKAVLLAPEGHARKPDMLYNLGKSYQARLVSLGRPVDLNWSISTFQSAANSPARSSTTKVKAAMDWARFASLIDSRAPLAGFQVAMDLLPQAVWIGSTISGRYDILHDIGAMAVEAAAAAISVTEYTRALEWLEEGRSIVWKQTLQLRTPYDDLSLVAPELTRTLKQVAQDLEQASLRSSSTLTPATDEYTLEATAQRHRRLAEQYDELLGDARKVPGFHDFMRPKKVTELLGAAQSGPVIVINAERTRCHALILRPRETQIGYVPLPNITYAQLTALQQQMHRALQYHGVRERYFLKPGVQVAVSFKDVLVSLWHKIVHPVLTFLGYTEKLPAEQLPHITWCTTGVLSFLPIHAAGCYDNTGNNIFNFAVSSYAPNLSTLLPSPSHNFELGSILAVGQEATPGHTRLPGTKTELAHIQPHANSIPYVQVEDDQATIATVLDAMEEYKSVHLACHASQNIDEPIKSCFYLHDGGMTLEAIVKKSLKNKGLAFLSACQTASGDQRLPDEAIHLAAGMLVAGYPTVIATMWSINDNDAPLIADEVYGRLVEDGKLNDGRAARALHAATAALRAKVGEEAFFRWAPYVHMGI